jgi:Bax protein
MHNLNTHRAYAEFRESRAEVLAKGEVPSGLLLSRYLTAYAELGKEYVYTLQAMILHNRFDLYEPYRLAR